MEPPEPDPEEHEDDEADNVGLDPDNGVAKLGDIEPGRGVDDQEAGGKADPDEGALEEALVPGLGVDDRVVGRPEDEAQRDSHHA